MIFRAVGMNTKNDDRPSEVDKKIPPKLVGDTIRSILLNQVYPQTLLSSAIRRCKVEQKEKVTHIRASIIKACLNQYIRKFPAASFSQSTPLFAMKLDPTNPSIGYNLGRLFAVLQKTQEEANPGLNATIDSRYFSAACTTPGTVFPTLVRLNRHHLGKLESEGRRKNLLKLMQEINQNLSTYFPKQLNMNEQGAFTIGYFHQMQAFYTKKDSPDTGPESPKE